MVKGGRKKSHLKAVCFGWFNCLKVMFSALETQVRVFNRPLMLVACSFEFYQEANHPVCLPCMGKMTESAKIGIISRNYLILRMLPENPLNGFWMYTWMVQRP